ncbi:MAG: aldose epimerase family protein [Anaerolineae bacterium]
MAHIDTNWRFHNLQVVRLESRTLCIDVLPEIGAKIYNLIHKPTDRNHLWHNPYLLPERTPFGADFDSSWSGGWDELVPNDLPRLVDGGELLPHHGEVWGQPAAWEIVEKGPEVVSARFVTEGRVQRTRFEKTISLREGESFCRVHYRYSNLSPWPIDYVWNVHPAMVISPATRLDVPARRGLVEGWREERFAGGTEFQWPLVPAKDGRTIDLRHADPPEAAQAEQFYLTDVAEGWYAVTDTAAKVGFGLVFPRAVFPHVWLFRVCGGWRGLYTLILELSSGYPYDLDIARATGHCGHVLPGQTVDAEVLAVAYAGVTSVERILPDGTVVPGKE